MAEARNEARNEVKTDGEIITSLTVCAESENNCVGCLYKGGPGFCINTLLFDALDLIGRLIVERDKANYEVYMLQKSLAIAQERAKRHAMRIKENDNG